MQNKILLTGASGFVGSNLLKLLQTKKIKTTVIARKNFSITPAIKQIMVDQIDSKTDWTDKLGGFNTLIHCAATAHNKGAGTLEHFLEINTNGTLHLAKEAALAGMKRFVFVSSIGVNGCETIKPFTEISKAEPSSDYAVSKYKAEEGLKFLAQELNFELVIIRPPLVYGANTPGNFGMLVKLVDKIPFLPFGLAKNMRSFISVDNLVDFILLCTHHPKAANELFLISDDYDLSIKELTNFIASGLQSTLYQLPFPVCLLNSMAKIFGKEKEASQLLGDLQVDPTKAKTLLNWTPSETPSNALKKLKQ